MLRKIKEIILLVQYCNMFSLVAGKWLEWSPNLLSPKEDSESCSCIATLTMCSSNIDYTQLEILINNSTFQTPKLRVSLHWATTTITHGCQHTSTTIDHASKLLGGTSSGYMHMRKCYRVVSDSIYLADIIYCPQIPPPLPNWEWNCETFGW